MGCNKIQVDDMTLVLSPPVDREKVSMGEAELEILKLVTVFWGIKQRVLREQQNRCRCVPLIRL